MRTWLQLFVLASAADLLTTALGLQAGIPEGNPLAASVLAASPWLAVAGKAAGVALVVGLVAWRVRRRSGRWLVAGWSLATLAVVGSNLVVLVGG